MQRNLRVLGVNIDHVATIRQARRSSYPDPVTAAAIAELAGANQITCHLRADRRHIQDHDLYRLRDIVQTQLNVEIANTEEMLSIVIPILAVHPWRHRVTLVPERPEEITTEGGLDVKKFQDELERSIKLLHKNKIHVSLFIDPTPEYVKISKKIGVEQIEINTAAYADGDLASISRIKQTCSIAKELELEIAAGHGLTHHNLNLLVLEAPEISEYNIGHSIIARAVFCGLEQAVQDILNIIKK
jgi:pyridoxine 5-phosphate synthase